MKEVKVSKFFNKNSCICRTIFDFAHKEQKKIELKGLSERPGFWDNPKQAGRIMQEIEAIEKEAQFFQSLKQTLTDLHDFSEGDVDETTAVFIEEEYKKVEEAIRTLEFQTLLGGDYDRGSALLTIRSGAGGVDAQDWAEMLLRMYLRYAERKGFRVSVLDETRGNEAGIKSVTIEIDGVYAYGYLHGEAGIHRLVRLSPFNANSLRQTSFASVEVMPVIESDDTAIVLKPEELRIDTYRSSGAGGQNVNKTESAVRITHLATNTVVTCQTERSQLQNRDQAMKLLKSKLLQQKLEAEAEEKRALRGEFKSAEWGNQIRSYVLHPYTLVKDHRTNTETSDTGK
ncbi:MAG: peptide chain release factor 2, partial [Candidatus Moranbacteria bacterium]|nr:peptide chain release factor 2 [Candidatus Moranbacteria bacterium]